MSNEKNMCDVCGENKVKSVVASSTGPVSYGYCEECIGEYEPYSALVAMGVKYDNLNPTYKEFVKKNLEFHDKTIEEFDEDVVEGNKEYEEFIRNNV